MLVLPGAWPHCGGFCAYGGVAMVRHAATYCTSIRLRRGWLWQSRKYFIYIYTHINVKERQPKPRNLAIEVTYPRVLLLSFHCIVHQNSRARTDENEARAQKMAQNGKRPWENAQLMADNGRKNNHNLTNSRQSSMYNVLVSIIFCNDAPAR